jgi:hypothetical protein
MNPFPLRELDVTIHQVEAVEFDDGPIAERINNLAGGAELKVATVRGWCGKTPTMPNLPGAFSITFAE